MAIVTNSYSNVVSSFFGSKFNNSVEELLVSPTPNYIILLGYVVGGISRGMLVVIVVLVTCCIAGCFLAIPYVGTVLLLPVLVFQRAYSLHFLAQFGPAYDVFPPAAAAGGGLPRGQPG